MDSVPTFEQYMYLENRVLAEIFSTEFAEEKHRNIGLLCSLNYKFLRWLFNRRKHRIVYSEGLGATFFVQQYSHFTKPKSLGI